MMRRHLLAASVAVVAAALPLHDAAAICGRKSCVVGSMPSGGGGGGYDPFAGMGGMVDMMFGVMGAIEAQQQQMARQNALDLNNRGIALYRNGDLVAAVAAFQQSLRLNPGDPNVRGNLEAAERELAELRTREAVRQQAERAAQQKRIAGLIDGIARGLDAAAGAPPSATADIEFMAPAGTSFFGTGGGPGGAARPAAPPGPAAGNAPAYSAPAAPAAAEPPLDFVGTKEPLFDKGGQASVPVDARGVAALPRRPVPAPAVPKLDFAGATEVARPPGPVTPDPIEYRSTGFRAWAVRNLAGPLMVGDVERAQANQTIPTVKAPPREGQPPPQMRPKPPMAAGEGLSAFEQRARELANLAFERIGAGDVDSATRFLETADTLAKSDPRFGRALDFAKTVPRAPALQSGAAPDRGDLLLHLSVPEQERDSAQSAFAGYRHLNNGDYLNATIEFHWARRQHADVDGPRFRELSQRETQARLGAILSGQH